MDIKDSTTYPYPIWGLPGNFKDDDPTGTYNVSFYVNKNCVIIDYEITSRNAGIEKLIEEGKAAYVCLVKCKATYFLYRKEQSDPHFIIEIPCDSVYKRFTCIIEIIAKEDIDSCTGLNVNEFYEGDVRYNKGSVIGFIDELSVPLDAKDNIADLSRIITTMATDVDSVKYDHGDQRIIVKYPKKYSSAFGTVELECPSIIEASLIYPALIFAISELKDYYTQDDKDWVYFLKRFIEDYGEKCNYIVPDDYIFEDTQIVFDIVEFILENVQMEALEKSKDIIDYKDEVQ